MAYYGSNHRPYGMTRPVQSLPHDYPEEYSQAVERPVPGSVGLSWQDWQLFLEVTGAWIREEPNTLGSRFRPSLRAGSAKMRAAEFDRRRKR